MTRIRFTRRARRDLDAIYDYWAYRTSPDIAAGLIYSISDLFPLIAEFPGIGNACSHFGAGIRAFPAGKYLIYFRKGRGCVQILQILHGARDQARAFKGAKKR